MTPHTRLHAASSIPIILLISSLTSAQTSTTIPPTADATIRSDQATTNFGRSTELGLAKNKASSIYYMRSYFQFDLAALAGKPPIRKASLMFYENRTIAAGGLPVSTYRVTGAWSEAAITWSSKPGNHSRALSSVKVGDNFNKGWKAFDITSLVREWRSGSVANQGVVIRLASERSAGAYRPGWGPSREHPTVARRPHLLVETSATRGFGRGCGPVATWPRLALTKGAPRPGQPFTITGSLLAPTQVSLTAIGLSNTNWGGVPLPLTLDSSVNPPCQLLVAAHLRLAGLADSQGQQAHTFNVPSDPKLVGVRLYFQMASPATTLHMTEGLELEIY